MFHPHTLVPGLLDVFSALQSYTEVADGFLRELLATAAPHHELVLDLLGSRGSFWGGSGRRVFVLSDSPPEWAIPAAQLLLGSKLPAANVLCREVKDKVEWLRGLLTAPPTLAPSTPTSGTALLGVGLLVGRDVLLIDGSREVVAWAQAEGCSTLLISGVHDAEVQGGQHTTISIHTQDNPYQYRLHCTVPASPTAATTRGAPQQAPRVAPHGVACCARPSAPSVPWCCQKPAWMHQSPTAQGWVVHTRRLQATSSPRQHRTNNIM